MHHGAIPQDYTAGEALKHKGQDDVLATEYRIHNNWMDEAEKRINELIAEGKPFTTNDVRDRCILEPHHHNCWGAITRSLARRDDVKLLGYVKSTRRQAHARPIQQWVAA